MKIIIFYLIILFHQNNTIAQNDVYEIKYSVISQLSDKGITGEYSMIFNNNASIFKSTSMPPEDKLIDDGGNNLFVITGDPDGMPIYKNLEKRVLESKYYIGKKSNKCIIKDTIPKISWKIVNETKEIFNIKVKKALGSFGGRIYEVWFAPSLSNQHGPFFLYGLPGLILEAKSQDKKIAITFLSFKKIKNNFEILPISSSIKVQNVSHSEYINKREQVYKKIKIDIESRGGTFNRETNLDSQIWKGYF